jgi:SAM-dependent methyltransferase
MSKVGREFYLANKAYAHELEGIEPAAYERYVAALAESGANGRVLDVGCGTGTAVAMLRARAVTADGCDVSPDFVARATQKAGEGFSVIAEDGALPYPDASFSSVGSSNVLEHVETPGRLLDEMCRVVQPGGTVVLACPNMLSLSWPRPRQGITDLLRIRLLNAGLLVQRAFTRKESDEFVAVECRVDMANYQPDFDAICLTNYFDIRRALRRRGLRITSYTSTERIHSGMAGRIADALFASPLGWALGAVFVVSKKAR